MKGKENSSKDQDAENATAGMQASTAAAAAAAPPATTTAAASELLETLMAGNMIF